MKKLLLVVPAAVAACLLAAGRVGAAPIWAGQCGIAAAPTVWGEYGWPSLLPIFGEAGNRCSRSRAARDYPARARAAGAPPPSTSTCT